MIGTIIKNRTFVSLFASTFFVFASFTAFFPVLPLYLKQLDASNFQIGSVMSAFPVGILLFRPVVSYLISKKGRRLTLIFGTVSLFLTSLLYFSTQNLNLLLLIRLLHGSGVSAFTTASIVLLSDSTTYENRGRIMGIMGIANYVGLGAGPYFADIVFKKWNINSVFVISALLALAGFIAVLWLSESVSQGSDHQSRGNLRETIFKRWVLVPAALNFLTAVIQGSILIFLPVFLKARGNLDAGAFYLFFSLAILFSRIIAGQAADRFGRGIVIVAASLFLVSAILTLSLTQTMLVLIFAALLYGAGYGSQQPTLSALVADNTSYISRSHVFAFYYSMFDVGVLSAGFFLGAIADKFSVGAIYPIAIVMYLAGIILFITQNQKNVSISLNWVLRRRTMGKTCKICNNALGVDPCHLCGHHGGFIKISEEDIQKSIK